MVQIAMTKEIYGDCKTYEPGEETTANARLIAAAPDLLTATQMLLDVLDELDDECDAVAEFQAPIRMARAAITKATTGAARATEGGV